MKVSPIYIVMILSVIALTGAKCGLSDEGDLSDLEKATDVIVGKQAIEKGQDATRDLAIAQAKKIFTELEVQGVDFSSGPCLSNDLIDGWVADVVHSPRQAIDDLPENQCQLFLEGKASHFVELDLDGNLIRAK